MDKRRYDRYMEFKSPVSNVWEAGFLKTQLINIGTEKEVKVSDRDVDSIRLCYDQAETNRFYHGPDHGSFVGQPYAPETLISRLSGGLSAQEAESLLSIAGLWHDAAYKHVDELDANGKRAWPDALKKRIDNYVEYARTEVNDKPVYTTTLTEAGKKDQVTQMVAGIFDVGKEGIIHNKGGNEFDSALAAAKFLEEKGAPPKSIITVVSAIAATVPFKPAMTKDSQGKIKDDGHMGDLAGKVKTAQLGGYEPTWDDTNDIMLLSVHLANRDVQNFLQPDNIAEVIANGREIKSEEVPELRTGVANVQDVWRQATLERSAPLLYQWFAGGEGPVPAENVPHIYIPRNEHGQLLEADKAYPPLDVYNFAVENTKRNSRGALDYSMAYHVGCTLTAAIAATIEEQDAAVPGFVDSKLWHDQAEPQGKKLTREEQTIYDELMHGTHQKYTGVSRTSPVSGVIFGSVGKEGIEKLSEYIIEAAAETQGEHEPFSNRETAKKFVEKVKTLIGTDNFRIITTELHRVARYYIDIPEKSNQARLEKLERLGDGLKEYPAVSQETTELPGSSWAKNVSESSRKPNDTKR